MRKLVAALLVASALPLSAAIFPPGGSGGGLTYAQVSNIAYQVASVIGSPTNGVTSTVASNIARAILIDSNNNWIVSFGGRGTNITFVGTTIIGGATFSTATNLTGIQSATVANGLTNSGTAPIQSAGGFVGSGTDSGTLDLFGITSGNQQFTVPDAVPEFTNIWSIATGAADGQVPMWKTHGGRPVLTNQTFTIITDPLTNQFVGIQTNKGMIRAEGGIRSTLTTASRPLYINAAGDITNATGVPDGTKFMNDAGALVTPSTASQTPVTQDINYDGFNPTNMQSIIGKQYLAFYEGPAATRAFYLDNAAMRVDGEISVGNNSNLRIYKMVDGGAMGIDAQSDIVFNLATTAPNYINTVSTVAGVGGANTNFTLNLRGPRGIFINAGTTNVNFLAAMNWSAATGRKVVAILTNLTATPRTWSLGSISNNWIVASANTGAAALAAPQQVTNSLIVELESFGGSNIWYSVKYAPNPTE